MSDPANWSSSSARQAPSRPEWRLPAMLVGGGIVVVVVAAIIGFQLGQKKEKKEWAENNAGGNPPTMPTPGGSGVVDPLNNGLGGAGVTDPNAPLGGGVIKPAPVAPVPRAVAPVLQDGWNYLVVASLRRPEAQEAAQYLADNDIACQLVPNNRAEVERGGTGANNALWQVWVLEGVPGGAEYSKHQAKQKALESKIQLLGRTWKAQNRKAPTDFAQVFWKKYKSG